MAITMAIALVLGVYLVEPWRFGRGLLAITLAISLPAAGSSQVYLAEPCHPAASEIRHRHR